MSRPEQPCDMDARLVQALADLDETEALDIVRLRVARGSNPPQSTDDCLAAIREVGERYAQRRDFLSGLIMAGEILRQVMETVLPPVEGKFIGGSSDRVLIGTVQGGMHDLGKNVVPLLLRPHGFSVRDLGAGVSAEAFVEEADHDG